MPIIIPMQASEVQSSNKYLLNTCYVPRTIPAPFLMGTGHEPVWALPLAEGSPEGLQVSSDVSQLLRH